MQKMLLLLAVILYCNAAYTQENLFFDGTNDCAQVNHYAALDFDTTDFTLEVLVNNPDFSQSDTLTLLSYGVVHSNRSAHPYGFRWSITADTMTAWLGQTQYAVGFVANNCEQLALVRSGNSLLFYANHSLIGTQTLPAAVSASCTNCDLLMGKDIDNTDFFRGNMDEIRMWNTARTASELATYQYACLDSAAVNHPQLVGYWEVEAGSGQFLNNKIVFGGYARLGSTFFNDNADPTWQQTNCITNACSNQSVSFSLGNPNPMQGQPVSLYNNSSPSDSLWWLINTDTIRSAVVGMDSVQYAFSLGMNVVQLVTFAQGIPTIHTTLVNVSRNQEPCAADELLEWQEQNDPNYIAMMQALIAASGGPNFESFNTNTYHIPVVFHVIAKDTAQLANFPLSRIQEQLDSLNAEFSNDSLPTNISFCLAQRLPDGSTAWETFNDLDSTVSVEGVTYTLDTTDFLTKYDYRGTSNYFVNLNINLPFAPSSYLNVYVVDEVILPNGNNALGVSSTGPTATGDRDGVALTYDAFINGNPNTLSNVLVHEVGHWLGLFHVFGASDWVCDTKTQLNATASLLGVSCIDSFSSPPACGWNPYYTWGENHMDYSTTNCLGLFTGGQIARMHYVLDNYRAFLHSSVNLVNTGLWQNGGCVDSNAVIADFTLSDNNVCAGTVIELDGINVPVGTTCAWLFDAYWDPALNGGNPAPMNDSIVFIDQNIQALGFAAGNPIHTTISIDTPGTWTVVLQVLCQDSGGNIDTLSDTTTLTIIDCSANNIRNLRTTAFDTTDWRISCLSIDTIPRLPSDTLKGYFVVGSDVGDYDGTDTEKGIFLQTDLLGTVQWRKVIEGKRGADVRLLDVAADITFKNISHCYAVTGYIGDSRKDILLIIINRQGTVIHQQHYPISLGGNKANYATGLHLFQRQNGNLIITGFAGEGVDGHDQKQAVVLSVDNTTAAVNWTYQYNSSALASADRDLAETTVEIYKDSAYALVVGGNHNRINTPNGSGGVFFSCLVDSMGTMVEEWREHVEIYQGNPGSIKLIDLDYANNRLWAMAGNDLVHGSYIFELDLADGSVLNAKEVTDLYATEMLIDSVYCTFAAVANSTSFIAAFQVSLPPVGGVTWPTFNRISRRYQAVVDPDYTPSTYSLGDIQNNFYEPQNFVFAPNGGYMFISEVYVDSAHAQQVGQWPYKMLALKLDDNLRTACSDQGNYSIGALINNVEYPMPQDSFIAMSADDESPLFSVDSLSKLCYNLDCNTGDALFIKVYNKCAGDTILLNDLFDAPADHYQYKWVSDSFLSSDTVLAPICFTPDTRVYFFSVLDTQTQCIVYEAKVGVNVVGARDTTEICIPCLSAVGGIYSYSAATGNVIDLDNLVDSFDMPLGGTWEAGGTVLNTTYTFANITTTANPIRYVVSDFCNEFYEVELGIRNKLTVVDSSQNTLDSVYLCAGDSYTFYPGVNIGNIRWFMLELGQGLIFTDSLIDTLQHTFIPSQSDSIQEFTVTSTIYNDSCIGDTPLYDTTRINQTINTPLQTVHVFVYPDRTPITIDSCAGRLSINLPAALADTVQWYQLGVGPLVDDTTLVLEPTTAGDYYAIIQTGCTVYTDTVSYAPLAPLSLGLSISSNYNGSPISCAGASDGQLTATASGGSLPYQYLWSDGQSTANANNLASGSYQLTLVDACGDTLVESITLSEPAALSLTTTGSDVNCLGGSDGTAMVVVAGGIMPYQYLWSNGQTTDQANGLIAGTYTVTVTDANGCTGIATNNIAEPTAIVTTISSKSDVGCKGDSTGAVTINAVGGTMPYSYNIGLGNQAGNSFNGLAAGGYGITVIDNNGCVDSQFVMIEEPDSSLLLTLSPTDVNCDSTNSGFISSTVLGGTKPYYYLWSNGQTAANVSGLTAGTYCVTVTDANGCMVTDCAIVHPLSAPLAITKTVDKDTIVPYDTVCYNVIITNNCLSPRTIVAIDSLPLGLVPTTLNSWAYDTSSRILTDTVVIAGATTDTLAFKVRVLTTRRCAKTRRIRNQVDAFDINRPTQTVFDRVRIWVQDTFASNCMPNPDTVTFNDQILAGNLLSPAQAATTNQTITVSGVWVVNAGLTYSFTNNSRIRMNPGAQIIVESGATLVVDSSVFRAACNCLWKSILVEGSGQLITRNRTRIRDAQYGIQALHNAQLVNVSNTIFRNNFIGIYVPPAAFNNIILGRFEDNVFRADTILPPFGSLVGTPTLDINRDTVDVSPRPTNGLGLAGILGWDMPAFNLNLPTATASNLFRNMLSGIVLFGSNFSTNSCYFRNIDTSGQYPLNLSHQGCGIHATADGALAINNIIINGLLRTSGGTSFNNCYIGVSGIGLGIQVYDTKIRNSTFMGVRSISAFDTRVWVRNSELLRMNRVGVGVFEPESPSDIWVDNCTFRMNTPAGQFGAAVQVNTFANISSTMNISNNRMRVGEAQHGILVNGFTTPFARPTGRIENNQIRMNGSTTDRSGITLLNSELVVSCNRIRGNGQTTTTPNTFGITSSMLQNSIIRCNQLDRTNVGVYFEGLNDVDFRGNRFDEHDTGLLLDGNAVIGQQPHEGNTWTGNTSEDAQNLNIANLTNSRFDVDPSIPSTVPNNFGVSLPNLWFRLLPGSTFNCNTPLSICGSRLTASPYNSPISNSSASLLSAGDSALVLGTFTTTSYSATARYNGERNLYRKLVDNPSLQQGVFSNFVSICQSNCIGHFDNVLDQYKQVFKISGTKRKTLDSLGYMCNDYIDTLCNLDSILAFNYSSNVVSSRMNFAQQLTTISNQRKNLLLNINHQQQTSLSPICSMNNSFSTIVKHELFEQQINSVYLNTIAKGILKYTNNQLTILRLIASDCPQEGGYAVHRARGMLSIVEDVGFLDFDCSSNLGSKPIGQEEKAIIEDLEIVLYPNPTDSELTVESNQVLEGHTTIEVYNSLGQQVQTIRIQERIQSIDIDASLLIDGVYIMRLKNGGNTKTKAFVVSK